MPVRVYVNVRVIELSCYVFHGCFYHRIPQVSVQPVTTTGPEHSKPLEKSDSLFAQDRDPRFSEIYSNINAGMFLPHSPLKFSFRSLTDVPTTAQHLST